MVLKQLSVGSLSLGHNIYFDITCFRGRAGGRDLNARTKFSCFSHKLITPTNLFALSPAYLSFKGIVPQKFLPIKNSLKHFKPFCEAVLFPSTTWYFALDHSYSHAPVTILIPNGSRRPPSLMPNSFMENGVPLEARETSQQKALTWGGKINIIETESQ